MLTTAGDRARVGTLPPHLCHCTVQMEWQGQLSLVGLPLGLAHLHRLSGAALLYYSYCEPSSQVLQPVRDRASSLTLITPGPALLTATNAERQGVRGHNPRTHATP